MCLTVINCYQEGKKIPASGSPPAFAESRLCTRGLVQVARQDRTIYWRCRGGSAWDKLPGCNGVIHSADLAAGYLQHKGAGCTWFLWGVTMQPALHMHWAQDCSLSFGVLRRMFKSFTWIKFLPHSLIKQLNGFLKCQDILKHLAVLTF